MEVYLNEKTTSLNREQKHTQNSQTNKKTPANQTWKDFQDSYLASLIIVRGYHLFLHSVVRFMQPQVTSEISSYFDRGYSYKNSLGNEKFKTEYIECI